MPAGEEVPRGGVVGLGAMGAHHARVLAGLQSCELAAVIDPDAERRELISRTHRASAHASLAEALEAEHLDFVCVAVPVDDLPEVAGQALRAGLDTLVEKPMAPTEEQARALIELAGERGALLAVGLVERFNPAISALKAKLDAGAIGAIHQMHARRLSPFPNRARPVSVALDLATHDIDVMRYIAGQDVQRVFAETISGLHATREDLVAASLRFDGGAVGVLEINWLTPTKIRQLSVTGEKGMLVVDYLTQDLMFFEHPRTRTEWSTLVNMRGSGEGDMVRFALDRREPLVAQWEAFLAARSGQGGHTASGEDGLAALSTALAVQRSGSTAATTTPAYRGGPPGAGRL